MRGLLNWFSWCMYVQQVLRRPRAGVHDVAVLQGGSGALENCLSVR